ncbi:MAG: Phosphate acetyltransferase [Actinomycetota bacterium]
MSQSLYIAATEERAGKALVALGVMDVLARRTGRVGIFRPVVADPNRRDSLVELLIAQFDIEITVEEACPLTYADITEFIEAGDPERVTQLVVEAYTNLRSRFDFMLIVGTDYVGPALATELDLNAELAANLGSPVLEVVTGLERDIDEIKTSALHALHVFEEHGCKVVGTVINRVDPAAVDLIKDRLTPELARESIPLYVLREVPVLSALTVDEVAAGLNGQVLAGEGPNMQREVDRYVAGSGHVPMVLGLLESGVMLVAAGDRSDLAVAAAAVAASPDLASPAGLLLTCGVVPDQLTLNLLRAAQLPVIAVSPDTYQTLHHLDNLRGEMRPGNRRKIAAALAEFGNGVDADALADQVKLSKTTTVTPLMFQASLMEQARANKRHIVLPEGNDERILRAAEELLQGGICDLTLLGDPDEVLAKAKHLGLDISAAKIMHPETSELRRQFAEEYTKLRAHKGVAFQDAYDRMTDPSYFGTMLVHFGLADGMVSGATHTTADTIRPALEIIKTVPGVQLVSSTFLMCMPDRVLAFADCAVNPDPNETQLAEIAAITAETAIAFGIEPRVAMLSYSTGKSGSGTDVDKVRNATEHLMQMRPELPVAGPIQYDAAVDAGVGKSKMPDNPVAGNATVLIFPDLNSGNTAYKAVQRSSNAIAIGPVLQGLKKPVNDLSRGCTVPDIVNTVAITAIQAQKQMPNRKEN